MANFTLDPERSSVSIAGTSSVHPISADAAGLTGTFEIRLRSGKILADPGLAGEVNIDVDKLRSGNALVDRETRRRINASTYPEISGVAVGSERTSATTMAVTGEISFRGEVVGVTGDLALEMVGDEAHLSGEQTFDVREWGLKLPRLGFLKVHPDVTVSVSLVGVPS